MADRKGKLCDDCLTCGKEEIIGTCSCLIMYMVVGTYEQGEIENDAKLPRFAWEIYAEYGERQDALEQRPVPRAELCACCWVKRLKKTGALKLLTHDKYTLERKAVWVEAHPEVMEARAAAEAAEKATEDEAEPKEPT